VSWRQPSSMGVLYCALVIVPPVCIRQCTQIVNCRHFSSQTDTFLCCKIAVYSLLTAWFRCWRTAQKQSFLLCLSSSAQSVFSSCRRMCTHRKACYEGVKEGKVCAGKSFNFKPNGKGPSQMNIATGPLWGGKPLVTTFSNVKVLCVS
jgi:hypothetical protein